LGTPASVSAETSTRFSFASERATFITGATLRQRVASSWSQRHEPGADPYSDDVPSLDRRITSSLTAVT
jgi:hypothetical protein